MSIDVHAHYFEAAYLDLLDSFGFPADVVGPGRQVLADTPDSDLAERFSLMERSGVERQILSMSAVAPYHLDVSKAVEAASFVNDSYAAISRANAERVSFFATLPMPHVQPALTELRRSFERLGAVGITFTTTILTRSLADAEFAPIFEELDRRSAIVFVHPAGLACESHQLRESGLAWSLGAPTEDTMCILQLMQSGFTYRYPGIKLIVPHLGGVLPFLIARLDRTAPRFMPGLPVPSEQVKTFYTDSVNGDPDSLRQAIRVFGSDRVLFGTDFPYAKGDVYEHAATYLETAGLSTDEVTAVRTGNARSIFGPLLPTSVRP